MLSIPADFLVSWTKFHDRNVRYVMCDDIDECMWGMIRGCTRSAERKHYALTLVVFFLFSIAIYNVGIIEHRNFKRILLITNELLLSTFASTSNIMLPIYFNPNYCVSPLCRVSDDKSYSKSQIYFQTEKNHGKLFI